MMEIFEINTLLNKFSLDELKKKQQVVIVDIRSPEEYMQEHIECSINVPLNELPSADLSEHQNKIAIFHCRSGKRTQLNEHVLANTCFKQKYCLAGGITAWKAAKLPVQSKVSAPIDVMRQVQLIVSLIIFVGLALGVWVSPYFLLITAFAGAGLLIAGLTGFCGMAEVLKFLPWNKPKN